MRAAIQVEGLAELNRSLRKVQTDYPKEMRNIHLAIAKPVAEDAQRRVRSRSGRLARTIRPSAGQRYARVTAGRKGLDRRTGYDYARINHYGGYPGSYGGNPFLTDARDAYLERSLDTYVKMTDAFLDRVWTSI